MARGRKHAPEQIVNVLRQIEVAMANGETSPAACKEAGIAEQTYYVGLVLKVDLESVLFFQCASEDHGMPDRADLDAAGL
jgi:hypothetical protein